MEKITSKPENNVEDKAHSDDEAQDLINMAQGMSPQELIPISHKEFNEFIKGKGFVGRNNYKLRELKAIFGFKPLTNKNQVTVTIDDGKEFNTYESISRASRASGIPYTTLLQARKNNFNPNASLLAIKFLFVLPLALLIFLFRSSIYSFICLHWKVFGFQFS